MEKQNTNESLLTTIQNSSIKWIALCLGAAFVVFIAIAVFKISVNNLFTVGILLACPLMHLWMMKSGGHKH
ncbi:DUF2933 domain-containing protein [Candidatus Gottesmanbacteria bacterium]|nr:DUF2933 domain-containing protein [Candidatus Gottesmanbacteria bacterium]